MIVPAWGTTFKYRFNSDFFIFTVCEETFTILFEDNIKNAIVAPLCRKDSLDLEMMLIIASSNSNKDSAGVISRYLTTCTQFLAV